MLDVLNLAIPPFALIFLGLAAGKFVRIPETGLAWMDVFVIYLAQPALFYRMLAKTPAHELTQVSFIAATTLATFSAFLLAFAVALVVERGRLRESTIIGVAGGCGNVGFMGPGLAIPALGMGAAAPLALVFCFDAVLIFVIVPILMALAGKGGGVFATARLVLRRVFLHPFIVASMLGVGSAVSGLQPPSGIDRLLEMLQGAAAPSALFALGVTIAARPVEAATVALPVAVVVKLVLHPVIVLVWLSLLGPFSETWVYTAILLAGMPPAVIVFILARQYDVRVAEASTTILFGTACSVVTVTTLLWLVKSRVLPLALF
ncbi:hypothetical protein A33M_2860 [Rhodovulum sp. PH10]|uniref:AEC family transporter n=1 Tax=Rhodovulum sp. PH10 TaxID=1187851 RepID=UPI00027C291D|nr:AEC family transporter [Rhodovulum sp. PH10]EJW11663.1 hypothetical protein A33M_2860 [Rhodovulum sp. PH10]